jgi:hypothetical protein
MLRLLSSRTCVRCQIVSFNLQSSWPHACTPTHVLLLLLCCSLCRIGVSECAWEGLAATEGRSRETSVGQRDWRDFRLEIRHTSKRHHRMMRSAASCQRRPLLFPLLFPPLSSYLHCSYQASPRRPCLESASPANHHPRILPCISWI